MSSLRERAELGLEADGFARTHPEWEALVVARMVELCQERLRVPRCSDCQYTETCTLWRAHARVTLYRKAPP